MTQHISQPHQSKFDTDGVYIGIYNWCSITMSHIKKYFEEPLIKIRRIIDRFEGPKVQIIFKVTIDFNINYDTA